MKKSKPEMEATFFIDDFVTDFMECDELTKKLVVQEMIERTIELKRFFATGKGLNQMTYMEAVGTIPLKEIHGKDTKQVYMDTFPDSRFHNAGGDANEQTADRTGTQGSQGDACQNRKIED